MNLEQMLEILGRLFTVCIGWNPELNCFQVDGLSLTECMNIRNSSTEQIVRSCHGSGSDTKSAVTDLWNKLTTLPEDGRVRVSQCFEIWVEYHWNGVEFVEVERRCC